MTHRLPRRVGLSMTKIVDRINTQSEGIVAQWGTLDDHDKAISDLWDECARIEQATVSRVNNQPDTTAMAIDNLDRVTADLLARVRDLELVVATEAATEVVAPRIVQDGSRLAGMAVDNTKEATRGDRDWALLALKRLREWAGILAGIGWQLPPCEILPLDPAEQHLRQAHDAVVRAQIGWETTLPGPLGQIADDIAAAIGHLKAWLTATAPPPAAHESQEQASAPELAPEDTGTATPTVEPEQDTPDPDDLLTLALKHVDRARDGDACTVDRACPLVDRLGIDHCDREHVSQALDLLRQWQDVAGADKRDYSAHVHWTSLPPEAQLSSAAWAIEYGLRWAHEREACVANAIARLERWQEQAPDDDVISAEILDADAAAEMPMPALPPDPTLTQRAGEVIHHLGLAMMGQDPGPMHWVNLARWELQGWPGVEPDSALTISAGQHRQLLPAAVGHVASLTCGAPRWHGAHAIACLDEWLRREAQA